MGKPKLSSKQVHNSGSPKTTIWWFYLVSTSVKVLLFPSYHSTDFEVHRNWLALTHSIPLSRWYFDETSPWTLDYPPFFAYFERFLSFFASLIDPQIVHLQEGLNYSSNTVVYFQRVTVVLSDLSLLYGVYRLTRNMDLRKQKLIWSLVIWSPMLFIVDHVHFQYNGFLIGILLISLSYLEEGRDLMGGFVFAVLLCFKHLFAVAAPVYFVYLLRHYCWGGVLRGSSRLLIMGGTVASVFAVAFGPFFYLGQIEQVLRRLFPFGRGLCHAYWAPNFWVFYIMSDKVLAFMLRKLGVDIKTPAASFTAGLVGDSSPFSILPQAIFIFCIFLLSE
ncbi:putative dolichyl-P-Glc:Glc(1)Man(9)GlcNAc(2)-PP-dolichol alpha-1,3- glucosyltransferase [Lupinus albus]|uniref:Alpha-1,3-glucosyltransferase n=1 Tax=Lupinus albus TaxID=3870 RepID=A0A6A4Q9C3_LUPAL|nr:putative dolichyl-P-Glc:Glc(1)Man(9)GlcNAc(2)-PP-dolichol alpha-1,3- glucosyltransferase [Lupinus albus]